MDVKWAKKSIYTESKTVWWNGDLLFIVIWNSNFKSREKIHWIFFLSLLWLFSFLYFSCFFLSLFFWIFFLYLDRRIEHLDHWDIESYIGKYSLLKSLYLRLKMWVSKDIETQGWFKTSFFSPDFHKNLNFLTKLISNLLKIL